jgi:NADH:ubiquinone oxidoreductase subunit B-like Fe-S oxidoreductase
MPEPGKRRDLHGACASRPRRKPSIPALVPVNQVVPVDVYVPGARPGLKVADSCIAMLQDKIQADRVP